MAIPPPGWTVYGVNLQCVHNEVLALQCRVLCLLGPIDLRGLWKMMDLLLPSMNLWPTSPQETWELMNKASRRKYRRFLNQEPKDLLTLDTRVRLFTKMERIPLVKRGKPKAPRAIQTRSQEYHWQLAKFTKPLEHRLYAWKVNGRRVIAKGLNLHQRAELLRKHMRPGMACFALDATDWDGHCHADLLKLEHRYYLKVFQRNQELEYLLSAQLRNKGRTMTGVSYLVEGARMSGDMNTALGNCVLAASLAFYALECIFPHAITADLASVVCDGDDTLVFAPLDWSERLQEALPRVYANFGHALRIDGYATELENIEFCQHKPLLLSNGSWVMVPNPRKVLQTAFMATGANAFCSAYYGTLWDCRARIHDGVPVYAPLFSRLAKENPARLRGEFFFGFEHSNPKFVNVPITLEQRAQFARVWDFPIEDQLAWEGAEVIMHPDEFAGDPAALG